MEFFGTAKGWGWGLKKVLSLKSFSHTYNDKTWHSYTLPKEDPQKYKSRDTPLEFC